MIRVKNTSIFFILFALFCGFVAKAQVKFGPEFNFTNPVILEAANHVPSNIVNNPENEKVVDLLAQHYSKVCVDCTVLNYRNRYGVRSVRVTFSDGWHFDVITDPGVVEINTSPMTVNDVARLSERMNEFIFNPIYQLGLRPANDFFNDWAGGHIHVDLKTAFGNDLSLFRNFIVDYTNHVELAHRIFGNDHHFAPSIQALDPEQKMAFDRLIKEVDAGGVTSIQRFAQRLQQEVYYRNPHGHTAKKHQALNVTRISDITIEDRYRTLEIRAFRSQENPEIFRLETQLIEKRIEFLKSWKTPIAIRWNDPSEITDEAAVSEFYRYVRDSNLDFKDYKIWVANLPPELLKKAQESYQPAVNSCRIVLK